ncbi:BRO-N domain-containing protein [Stutzerimonas nitrititolerans]|uniref:BRO-N domain-containing protein n=1 Tax=Stutzerimonas nitrititolerans TaxID=2482751 RepID=UPI00289C4BEE|nr:BRO family protein [Stutzerimonas nitrititolerans]
MQFTKQSFMGIELDILIGHPEHDILFIATQVARAAGLKNPSYAASTNAKRYGHTKALQVGALLGSMEIPQTLQFNLQKTSWLFTDSATYEMLLRGHAPASEPFRKWVTEVVLPSIRKTGKFDVNEAQDDTSKQFAGELAALHAEVSGLKAMIQQLLDRPTVVLPEAQQSPYEGTGMSSLSDGLLFDKPTYRHVGESVGLARLAMDRLEDRVVLALRSCRQPPNDGYMILASVPLPV